MARLKLQIEVGTVVRRFPNTDMCHQELGWTSEVIRRSDDLVIALRPQRDAIEEADL
jgi:hypothetical protein